MFALALLASPARAQVTDPYVGLEAIAGESHQHAATYWMIERLQRDPPVPGFLDGLHENGRVAVAFDLMRQSGYEWGTVVHHDTNAPGARANISIAESSGKYYWWRTRIGGGFPGANPPWNEALALALVARSKTVEGAGGFLAFSGREFTSYADKPSGVASREGGHKVVILPGETTGLCASDGALKGDEYCADEFRLYRGVLNDVSGQGIIIQAHPGWKDLMDLRPVHPVNAPGGFSDAFVQGVEVSHTSQDPMWEPSYQRMLQLGYRVFPAVGSDSHDASQPGRQPAPRFGATVCWVEARTRPALIRAMHLRRCYYAMAWKPVVRFSARRVSDGGWVGMGGSLQAPAGRIEVRVDARNDRRNFDANPRRGKRFDYVEIMDSANRVLATGPCTRAADGQDTCTLVAQITLPSGAIYPRVRMRDPDPLACRSRNAPDVLPNCDRIAIGGAIYVNWPTFLAQSPYRPCTFGRSDAPCRVAGCLAVNLDRDQDGYPNGCDVCPELANPDQRDANKDGFGDACGRGLAAPEVIGSN